MQFKKKIKKFGKKSAFNLNNVHVVEVSFLTKKDTKIKPSDDQDLLERYNFKGIKGNLITTNGDRLLFGISGIKDTDDWRELGYKVFKEISKIKTVTEVYFKNDLPENSKEFIEGLLLADYSFTKYKTDKKKKKKVTFYLNNFNDLKETIKKVQIAVDAQNTVRDLVNTPAEDMHQSSILKFVQKIFTNTEIGIQAYSVDKLKSLGMNAHVAVSRASIHKAMTIKLTYEPKKFKKHIVLVGKGLVYDTGGLNIKTDGHMLTMKIDKSGAMTLIGLMQAISKTGSKNKITVYLALADNAIDGNAFRPDDVFTMKCGKTVHIKNTDAEGRLVLGDNLALAEEENPDLDEIYSLATLTGAAIRAFGSKVGTLVGFNQTMKKKVTKAGKKAGEIYMDAKFNKYMMDAVDDDIADLSNLSNKGLEMGSQTAGLFLTKTLKEKTKKKYMHLDFAGPVYASSPWGTNPKNATGFATRTFIELLT